jgi:hypothetical protein
MKEKLDPHGWALCIHSLILPNRFRPDSAQDPTFSLGDPYVSIIHTYLEQRI